MAITREITAQQVSDWLGGVGTPAATDDPNLKQCVAATNALVAGLPTIATVPDPDDPDAPPGWADQTITGAIMLAARLVRRRNSPAGVEALLDSGPAYVSRYDSDISRMLRLDRWTPPQIG